MKLVTKRIDQGDSPGQSRVYTIAEYTVNHMSVIISPNYSYHHDNKEVIPSHKFIGKTETVSGSKHYTHTHHPIAPSTTHKTHTLHYH